MQSGNAGCRLLLSLLLRFDLAARVLHRRLDVASDFAFNEPALRLIKRGRRGRRRRRCRRGRRP